MTCAAPAPIGAALAGAVDEHVPHRERCDRLEVRLAAEVRILAPGETEKDLVDDRRRLERVIRGLATKVMAGLGAQLVVDEREEPVDRFAGCVPARAGGGRGIL